MEITLREEKDILIVRLQGRLNIETAPGFFEQIVELINRGHDKVIINFEHVDYVSSAGIQALYQLLKVINAKDGKLVICSVEDDVRYVFELVDLQDDIPLCDDIDAALACFN